MIESSSPFAYWQLGDAVGSSTAVDSSGNGNTGTYASCVKLGKPGPIRDYSGTSGLFGRHQGCWMTATPAGSYTGSFTVEAWVKPTGTTRTFQTFFDTRFPSAEYGFDFKLLGSDARQGQSLFVDVGDGSNWMSDTQSQLGGYVSYPFKAGTWYYVAASVNATKLKVYLYVNGTLIGSSHLQSRGLPPLLFDSSHQFAVGGNPLQDQFSNFGGIRRQHRPGRRLRVVVVGHRDHGSLQRRSSTVRAALYRTISGTMSRPGHCAPGSV